MNLKTQKNETNRNIITETETKYKQFNSNEAEFLLKKHTN